MLLACADPQAPTATDESSRPRRDHAATPAAAARHLGLAPLAYDDRGVPRLVRATQVAAAPGATPTASAIAHVSRLSAAWGVRADKLPDLAGLGEVKARGGATISRVRQTIDGLPVHRGELRVMTRGNGELVAANGVLVGADVPREQLAYTTDDAAAIALAVKHNFKRDFAASALAQKQLRADGTRIVGGRSGQLDVQLARATKAWHHTGVSLVPAWVVEAYAGEASSTNSDAFRTVIAADGSRVLSHHSLVSDVAFQYRVFAETSGEFHPFDGPIVDSTPHPTGVPDGNYPGYVAPNLVSVDGLNHPSGTGGLPDPWLLSGRTETLGNNVEAYSDINPPSGLTFGDYRATVTSTRTFDRTYDTSAPPLAANNSQQMASITSLFYGINWLHDFWYDAGFTEAAGNAQDDNYGRGGEDRDAILAEAQDNANGGSRNNANMATPSDGLPPRMQVFLWSGRAEASATIQPADRQAAVQVASYGPQSFDVTAPIMIADDGVAPGSDACTALPAGSATGKIVLVDRGTCTFKTKTAMALNAGAVGVLVANNAAGLPAVLGDDATITTPITIGTLAVSLAEGDQLKTEIAAGTVTVTLHRLTGVELDGGLDSTLVAHEYGHYLHHRLQDCTTAFCRAQSEGWGDFLALLLMLREGDDLDGVYPFSVYVTQSFTGDPAYFGIRRGPYSARFDRNALMYRHMSNGVALPTNHPFLPSGANSQVHNSGEVWASSLWEAYVALQKAGSSFHEVRAKMAQYIVSGLMMSPVDATPTETRDALLAVADPADRAVMLAAFARRGFGSCAVTPDRDSTDFAGIVESTIVAGRAVLGDVALDLVKNCDGDNYLDGGETAELTLPIANAGHVPLTDVTVTVTSTTPGVTVVSAPTMLASFAPGASQDLIVEVKLDDDVTGPVAGEFEIAFASNDGCVATLTAQSSQPLNVDDAPATSANDNFDAASVWVPNTGTAQSWHHVRESALDAAWHGDDLGAPSDTHLTSPLLKVGTAPFSMTFSHRHDFEFSGGTAWDGGMIEISIDGGTSWADASTFGVTPGYTGPLSTTSQNPLAGRPAYSGRNAAYPDTDTVELEFGTQFENRDIKVRFRIGTDAIVGGPGWRIDDLVFTGLTNTPFPTQIADAGTCPVTPGPGPDGAPLPPDEEPGCCSAGPIRTSNLALVFGVLALVLRRRRRR